MHPGDDRLDVVVGPRGPDLPGERGHVARDEPDLAVLVLDVDLDRVQAEGLQRRVVLELAGQARERRGHVDAAHLGRVRPGDERLVDQDRRLRGRPSGTVAPAHLGRAEADPGPESKEHGGRRESAATAPA